AGASGWRGPRCRSRPRRRARRGAGGRAGSRRAAFGAQPSEEVEVFPLHDIPGVVPLEVGAAIPPQLLAQPSVGLEEGQRLPELVVGRVVESGLRALALAPEDLALRVDEHGALRPEGLEDGHT